VEAQVRRWLSSLNGTRSDPVVDEMRAIGTETVFPLLRDRLADPDPEVRCAAILSLVLLDSQRAVEVVAAMLADPDATVRWQAAGCLHDFGDERAIPALVKTLRRDSDPMVRGTAAYALGGIGCPAAIPALLAALGLDNEADELGHTPSGSAATALDDILGTDETRIKLAGSLCTIRAGKPDLDLLRQMATERYQQWSRAGAEPGAADVTSNVKSRHR
jgi:HEAT repeat protein